MTAKQPLTHRRIGMDLTNERGQVAVVGPDEDGKYTLITERLGAHMEIKFYGMELANLASMLKGFCG